MSLLVSTKIYTTRCATTKVARDWRVVMVRMVPDDNNTLDVLGLYTGIGSHAFDQLEPFTNEGDTQMCESSSRAITNGSRLSRHPTFNQGS